VFTAEDGESALALFLERREEIGMVVTDQIMPRMQGLRLLAEVAKAGPEVVRILSTAYADSEDVAEAAERGLIESFIIKPWEIERVETVLNEAAEQFAGALRERGGRL
jgi:DNA-binding NtrC family response regulator